MNNQELRIEILLEEVVKKRASDLHIQVGLPPMLRIDGSLMPAAGTQPIGRSLQLRDWYFRFLMKISDRFC